MSDPVTSGDPSGVSAATAGPATTAPSPGNSAPIGSFGTAKGSGLLRGKRPTPPAASAASSAAPSGYQPSTIEVIRPQSEYKNPFTGETSVPTPARPEPVERARPEPVVSEPSVVKAESRPTPPVPQGGITEAPPPAVAKKESPAAAVSGELFPLELSDSSRKAEPATKAELNILPSEEVKRPAVSWGEHLHGQNNEQGRSAQGEPRGRRDERPTFRPERRDGRDGREGRPFESREPRREPAAGERGAFPREQPRDPRDQQRDFRRDERPAPAAEPQKKSGGFFGWLKGLFAEKPAQPEIRTGGERDEAFRDGQGREGGHRHNRRRHRGGRGRGGYNGENRGPRDPRDQQPRDPREEGGSSQGGEGQGEHRYEGGGGGRRRHRGGRGRYRDDRGGPRPEGQQGGGAI